MSGTNFPVVVTPAGPVAATPAEIRARIVAAVAAARPGYTANLPGSLIEDIVGTDVAAVAQSDAARVELINSVTPYAANGFLLRQLGNIYGVPLGDGSTTSVYVVFTGSPGFVVSRGFTVSDGTYQYVIQDGGVVAESGMTAPLYALAIVQGTWAVPANTVTQLITSVPSAVTLSVNNPQAGTPGTAPQTEAEYRAQVIQAGLAISQGMATALRTSLELVEGVQPRLISFRQKVGAWQILVGGGDPYQVAYAIFMGLFDISTLVGSTIGITGVTKANPGVVSTDITHGLADGDEVEINDVLGMIELNGNTYTVTVIDPHSFSIGVDTTGFTTYTAGGVVTPNARNREVSLYDFPDTYIVRFVVPLQQIVQITVTWDTTSPNLVAPGAVAQLGAPALVAYVNSIVVGQPINLFQLESVFRDSVASVVPPEQLTRMVFVVTIDGVATPPISGTGIIEGDPESYFFTDTTQITINQG